MFEFDKFEPSLLDGASKPAAGFATLPPGKRRALLLWSEHCTECAAPDCYASCALYAPRPDGRCRRLEFGMLENRAFRSAVGFGAEIQFKRWGMLVARGNLLLLPARLMRALESAARVAVRWLDRSGAVIAKLSGDARWRYLGYAATERVAGLLARAGRARDLSLVVELYNPAESPVDLVLSIGIPRAADRELDRTPPFIETIRVPPGYFSKLIPSERFGRLLRPGRPFDVSLAPAREDGARLIILRLDLASGQLDAEPRAEQSLVAAKCVIFDLDQTLWQGILVEGEVLLKTGIKELFDELDRRGILLSVASKNDPEAAMERLRALGLDHYLLHPQIGWGRKSEGVAQIARRLNIGTDSLLLIDDSPFERAEVEGAVPGVTALPETALETLLLHPRLAGGITGESGARRRIYQEAAQRQGEAESFGGSYEDFLRSCDIRITLRPHLDADRDRIHELVQRTNQLNFSGRKYGREEIDELLADQSREAFVVTCSDRFGDYGLIGFCLTRRIGRRVAVDDLMLSCRVQAKGIERALLRHLVHRPGWSAEVVEVAFRETARNGPASEVLSQLGFEEGAEGARCARVGPESFATDLVTVDGCYSVRA